MEKIHHSFIRLAVLGGAFTVALDSQAAAALDMEFSAPTTGSIAYAGGIAPLIGTNIQIDNIVGLETPLHDLIDSACVNCLVQFTSGAFTSYDSATKMWNFSGGGTINVVGGVDFSDNSTLDDILAGTNLLTGTFQSASVQKLSTGRLDFRIASGSFTDTKNATLLAYYGLPTDVAYVGGFNLSFAGTTNTSNNSFTSTTIYSGDLVNAPMNTETSTVPVPGAIWLLGSGLLGLVSARGLVRGNKKG